ncbi:MAG: chemotaxis-specific protein-glutamate methyltransferase CheB [Anaerolineae bacterium]|nr:chemotaxis-specific protein-glutamate methyltransferase CheB [Anaerolineae bacterium]
MGTVLDARIRILIVDDSQVVRDLLVQMLQSDPEFEIVGQATDGIEAVQLTATLKPDVITMDMYMPNMNGLDAIRQIMNTVPTPIVLVAGDVYGPGSSLADQAVAAGALMVVEKPKGLSMTDYDAIRGELVTAIRLMAGVQLVTLAANPTSNLTSVTRQTLLDLQLIAVAASTGGPGVLHQILRALPADFSIPIVVVQHITAGFGQGFAQWLDSVTQLNVRLAQDKEPIVQGGVLIAPEGAHMVVRPGGIVRLDTSPLVDGVRPSATRLFASVAKTYKAHGMGVVLTGMGADGAEGMERIWQSGGYTIAQDEASCVVFGMPKMAIERGVVHQVLTPEEIIAVFLQFDARRKRKHVACIELDA